MGSLENNDEASSSLQRHLASKSIQSAIRKQNKQSKSCETVGYLGSDRELDVPTHTYTDTRTGIKTHSIITSFNSYFKYERHINEKKLKLECFCHPFALRD